MLESQPLWKDIRAGHDDDIKSQNLSRYPENRVNHRCLVIPLMKNLGHRRRYLLLERWPHYQSDHQQVQEKHRRLANTVSSVAFVSRKKSPSEQDQSHDELHD